MKVSELIAKLQQCNPDNELALCPVKECEGMPASGNFDFVAVSRWGIYTTLHFGTHQMATDKLPYTLDIVEKQLSHIPAEEVL